MNNFLIYEGNQPVYLDDLQFINQATADSLTGIIKSILQSDSTVILYGCLITQLGVGSGQTEFICSAGYISVSGTIYEVKSGTVRAASEANLYWEIVTEKDGLRRLGNGTEEYVYEKKYIRLSTTGSIPVSQSNTLYKFIKNNLYKQNTEWDGTVTDLGDDTASGSIKYKLLGKEGTKIFLNVTVNATTEKNGVIFRNFPVEQATRTSNFTFMVSAIERTASGLLPVILNLVVTPSGYVTAYKNGEIYKNDAGETTIKCVVELYNSETV